MKIHKLLELIKRNQLDGYSDSIEKNVVNVEFGKRTSNLGDTLGPVIVQWMLEKKHIDPDQKVSGPKHLLTVGSIIAYFSVHFDATVWGSGILNFTSVWRLKKWSRLVKYDIRAVRGPVTREALLECGYDCPEVYGDPAVLMPLIYQPKRLEEQPRKPYAIIHHIDVEQSIDSEQNIDMEQSTDGEQNIDGNNSSIVDPEAILSIETKDYKAFIEALVTNKKIISSSLHGVILAESYGIPAVFVNENMTTNFRLMKIHDWYYSTGRMSVKIASSVEEALTMEPMPLPDLTEMQQELMDSFPYDLWEGK